MTPAVFAGRSTLARRALTVCASAAAVLLLSADTCDRPNDIIGTGGSGQTTAAGRYGLSSVVRTGTDSLGLPVTYTNGSTYVLSGATLTLTAGASPTQSNTFTLTVSGTQNGLASALLIPGAGTWTQTSSTVNFSAVDGSTFSGTLSGSVLRLSPVTIEGRGASALRFTRL